jgi:hydrogenase expression/formation protein HypD
MKDFQAFRGRELSQSLAERLRTLVDRPLRFMEVCGTHTVSVFRYGLRSLFPEALQLISGPGCPVCVTAQGEIDAFIEVSGRPNVIVATFGDLVRVPGTHGSLATARAEGARVEVVYSPMDALQLAKDRGEELVVFLAVGFETTVPGVAATVREARRLGLANFAVYAAHKTMPRALEALFSDTELGVDGLLCPGHVSTIIGAGAFEPLAKRHGIPCVVAGFEPTDIINALILLARQTIDGRAEVENAYPRAVSWQGNRQAMKIVSEVFQPADAEWRGLGTIPASGLVLRPEYGEFDAAKRLDIEAAPSPEPRGCLCGRILRGQKLPPDCPFFAGRCTPLNPVGPCMVSTEGTCAAYYRYGRDAS